ncbi:MAG: hypothetical protein ILA26_02825 [Methanobrevibacter sp.]|uniref:hypothetical protein n=1 Tax=Methanobrevibacter sp. TaxID=66852 RepID=UPI001B402247|nr:hypothetical protein [Methanobrevibacter sp.]MBP3790945.1 hypothetical protein [Methanobrevibacter sp.]
MLDLEFSDKIKITKSNGESIELDQSRVHIRENEKGLMGVSYVAPVFEAMDLEKFFGDVITSENLMMDIGGTGDFQVSFRGIVEGRGKEFPQNWDHRIILLQEPKFLDPRVNLPISWSSRLVTPEERFG